MVAFKRNTPPSENMKGVPEKSNEQYQQLLHYFFQKQLLYVAKHVFL